MYGLGHGVEVLPHAPAFAGEKELLETIWPEPDTRPSNRMLTAWRPINFCSAFVTRLHGHCIHLKFVYSL